MATAKTGSFFLTETVTLPAGGAPTTPVQGVIDLGAYVNVPTGQAIAITEVDFVVQHAGGGQELETMLVSNGAFSYQVTDLNPGTALVIADNASLVASGALNIDQANNIGTIVADLYPDSYGPASLSEAFMVVNDSLYLVCQNNGSNIGAADIKITARIRAQVVKLSTKDWMAIAIQSTASDN